MHRVVYGKCSGCHNEFPTQKWFEVLPKAPEKNMQWKCPGCGLEQPIASVKTRAEVHAA